MIDHRKQRRIIQWKWPERLVKLSEAWDGVEDRQVYLDRAATWKGVPITPAEIDAEEANYDAVIAGVEADRAGQQAVAELAESGALRGLIRALIDPTFSFTGKTEQQVIDTIKARQ